MRKIPHRYITAICMMLISIFLSTSTSMLMPTPMGRSIQAYAANTGPENKYKAAILVETYTGEILYQYNMNKVLPQASLTKLMTYYTFMGFAKEHGLDMKKKIRIDVKSFHIPWNGSQIRLKKGDMISIEELLVSLLVVSANDSAEALKRIYNSHGFDMLADMNRQSRELGFANTRFVNVSGLTEEIMAKVSKTKTTAKRKRFNVTTARELADLSCIILNEFPDILRTTSKSSCVVNNKGYRSTNKLLFQYKSIDGLKTGSTDEAGYCVAATEDATGRIGQGMSTRLLAIVLGCPTDADRFREAKRLLDYGTANFVNYMAVSKDRGIRIENEYYKTGSIKCVPEEDIHILIKKESGTSKVVEFTNKFNNDIRKGEKIGVVKVSSGNHLVEKEIFAASDFKRKALPFRMLISLRKLMEKIF